MKKILSILFALVLVLSFSLIPAMATPVEAQAPATLHVSKWTEYAGNPVFDPTERAYYPTILFDGTTYHMWYDDGTGIRYTTSSDGITWAVGTPVTGLTNARHPLVEYIDGKYMIWYWDTGVSIYTINALRYAESTDGVNWSGDQPLTQDDTYKLITGAGTGWNRGSYGPGDVIYNPSGSATLDDTNIWNNKYVIYYMATNGSNEYIGLAYSVDGKHWKRYGDDPVLSPCTEADDPSVGWDYRSVGYPTVIKDADGIWHMWFCGGPNTNHGIGYAWSNDGISWTKDANNPIFHKDDGVSWRADRTYRPMVIEDGGIYKMWFSGKDAAGNYAIGYATADGPFPSIQVAIDAASAGDTIIVHEGTYTESLNINKSVTLQGEDRNTTVIQKDVVWLIQITSDNVKITGFSILGRLDKVGHVPCAIFTNNRGLTIEDNIIEGYFGIVLWDLPDGDADVTIKDNYIRKVRDRGIVQQTGNPENLLIEGNTIEPGDILENVAGGIYIQGLSNSTIRGNTIRDFPESLCPYGRGIEGSDNHNITIEGNKFENIRDAITLWLVTNITIKDNYIDQSDRYGINIKGQDILITGNTIQNSGDSGINIAEFVIETKNVAIHYNNLVGNANFGVKNQVGDITVDATNNWWGSPTGPCRQLPNGKWVGKGDEVSANVAFVPWLPQPVGFWKR